MANDTTEADDTTAAKVFAAKATDLQALRDAVVDAASVGGGLWLSYVFVFFYLAVAVGGVTHSDLFFKNPVKLPFLNVDLPLIGFFVFGPLLFLIVHTYTLLHFTLLAGKIGAFDSALQEQIAKEDIRARLRRQLPSNIFVQFLAGPREVRGGTIGSLLKGIAWISLVIGPVLLLVFFQLQFLPYHSEVISWWQRLTVVGDLVVLWLLWPSVVGGTTTSLRWHDFHRVKVVTCLAASVVPVLLVFTIATFPGEWLEDNLPRLRFIPISWVPIRRASMHELLVAGAMDDVAQRPKSLWSNRLVLPGIGVFEHANEAKSSGMTETIPLRGRRLEGAVLSDAHLRKADFTGAHLAGAVLAGADLQETKFGSWRTGFTAAFSLTEPSADLRGANLTDAQLQGANLAGAQLQGANLQGAQLQGAILALARLQGANLRRAALQGAELLAAELQGADLHFANLQGAVLDDAWLQGAQLGGAKLQGASLYQTQLLGASLKEVQLQGALLYHIFGWRSNVPDANAEGARVVSPETGPKYLASHCVGCDPTDWSPSSFVALKQLIERQVPKGVRRDEALRHIAVLDLAAVLPEEEASVKPWADLAASSPSLDDYYKGLAKWLRATGCDAKGAPFVIRLMLLLRSPTFGFAWGSPQPAALATSFLDEINCPGSRGLSDKEKYELQKIRDQPAPAPAPTTPK